MRSKRYPGKTLDGYLDRGSCKSAVCAVIAAERAIKRQIALQKVDGEDEASSEEERQWGSKKRDYYDAEDIDVDVRIHVHDMGMFSSLVTSGVHYIKSSQARAVRLRSRGRTGGGRGGAKAAKAAGTEAYR